MLETWFNLAVAVTVVLGGLLVAFVALVLVADVLRWLFGSGLR